MELKFALHFQLSLSKPNCSWMKRAESENTMESLIASRKQFAIMDSSGFIVDSQFFSMAPFQNRPLGKSESYLSIVGLFVYTICCFHLDSELSKSLKSAVSMPTEIYHLVNVCCVVWALVWQKPFSPWRPWRQLRSNSSTINDLPNPSSKVSIMV